MWKLLSRISLTLCLFAGADAAPPEPFVRVACGGRLRHGIVSVGGETTGTTITFHRIVWELRLRDDTAREFATTHNKQPVMVTGTLRKVAGIEVRDRWIIDVATLAKRDVTTDVEGVRMTVQGTLRTADPDHGDRSALTIDTDDQVWPIDVSADAALRVRAASLVGRPVLLTGKLERAGKQVSEDVADPADEDEAEADARLVIRVKALKLSDDLIEAR